MVPFFSSAVGNIITVKVRRRQAIDRRWRLCGISDVDEHCRYGDGLYSRVIGLKSRSDCSGVSNVVPEVNAVIQAGKGHVVRLVKTVHGETDAVGGGGVNRYGSYVQAAFISEPDVPPCIFRAVRPRHEAAPSLPQNCIPLPRLRRRGLRRGILKLSHALLRSGI